MPPMDALAELVDRGRAAFVLRPHVQMPDWSLVGDPVAREALAASMAVARRLEKWSGLDATEDQVWQATLREFARTGRAPDAARLVVVTDLDEPVIAPVLRALHRRDLLVLDEIGGAVRVTAAYPFCEWEAGHRVQLRATDVTVNCLCAIDALGAGAMLGCDTLIETSCRECAAPIRVETQRGGHALRSVEPGSAVIWSGIQYADGCCATSGCTTKVFFCSDSHLAAWRECTGARGIGFLLSVEQAMQVGKGLFVPMLAGWVD